VVSFGLWFFQFLLLKVLPEAGGRIKFQLTLGHATLDRERDRYIVRRIQASFLLTVFFLASCESYVAPIVATPSYGVLHNEAVEILHEVITENVINLKVLELAYERMSPNKTQKDIDALRQGITLLADVRMKDSHDVLTDYKQAAFNDLSERVGTVNLGDYAGIDSVFCEWSSAYESSEALCPS